MTAIVLLFVLAQAEGWRTSPAAPTVGDTIWVERTIEAREGWVVRPGPWEPDDERIETLGAVVTALADGGVVVRYPLVAWEPGSHELTPPPAWRIGPGGEADSVPGGRVAIVVSSVLPADSIAPRPPREPIERRPRTPVPAITGFTVGIGLIAGVWRWRRRKVRSREPVAEPGPRRRLEPTGDPRVDAARLTARLRRTVALAAPAAHRALTTEECLAILASERPDWPLGELGDTLRRLDAARFAPPADHHLTALAEEVETLERGL